MEMSGTSIDIMETGKKLKTMAINNGYSVKDIQEYLGLSCPQSIYRWYKGVILPSVDNLFRLSELYHVHMEELLVRDNEIVFLFDYVAEGRDTLTKRLITYSTELVA